MLNEIYELKPLFIFPTAFVGTWLALLIIKKWVWRRLEGIFKRTQWEWDDELLKALERPCRYLILFGSLSVTLHLAPDIVSKNWLTHAFSKASLVVVMGWIVDRMATVFLFHTESLRGLSTTLKSLLKVVLRILIYSIVSLIILDSFGVSITPLLASLGVGSLAVALALQDTLGNLFSGFYLVLDRPVRVDDFIRLEDGTEGKVRSIGWRSTKIELGTGNTVILPNAKLSSSRITNFELPTPEVTFTIPFNISIKNDPSKVETVVQDVAKRCQSTVPGTVHNFEPVIHFQALTETGINLSVAFRCQRVAELAKVRHEFIKQLVERCKKEGFDLSAWNQRLTFPPTSPEAL